MSAIFKREFRSYFHSPLGYIFLAVVYFFAAKFFIFILQNQVAYIEYVFGSMLSVVMILIPFLTMRLMSEDKKLKTDQLLLTSPTNIGGVVWGKYFAAFAMYLLGIASTILFIVILATFTTPNWNIFLGNFLGLALLGGALIAIGLFVSSLTESQMIAAVITYAITMFISIFGTLAQQVPTQFSFVSVILQQLSFTARYDDLISGILNISHIIFYISVIVIFNFLTVRVLEKKRWS